MREILMVRLSAIGDCVLALPLAYTLREAFPEARIRWLIGRAGHSLIGGVKAVEFVVADKPRGLSHYWTLARRFRRERFDVVLAMQANFRVNLIYPLLRAERKIGFDPHRGSDGHGFFVRETIPFAPQHLCEGFLSFAAALNVHQRVLRFDFPVAEEAFDWARERCPPEYWAVNPAASKAERNWLPERYAEVILRVYAETGLPAVLTGGNDIAEQKLALQVRSRLRVPCIDLVGKTTLPQLAAVLKGARCLLAPDTGPAHIAAALGTPVVGLFAVAPPELSAPYPYRHLVVNKYPDAVRTVLDKNADQLPWATRVHEPRAMALIETEEVCQKLFSLLSGASCAA